MIAGSDSPTSECEAAKTSGTPCKAHNRLRRNRPLGIGVQGCGRSRRIDRAEGEAREGGGRLRSSSGIERPGGYKKEPKESVPLAKKGVRRGVGEFYLRVRGERYNHLLGWRARLLVSVYFRP